MCYHATLLCMSMNNLNINSKVLIYFQAFCLIFLKPFRKSKLKALISVNWIAMIVDFNKKNLMHHMSFSIRKIL